MSNPRTWLNQWIPQSDCPCSNFTKPFVYSSNEYILANSAKFNQTPFLIYKFNCKQNEWNRFKILPSETEDPTKLIIEMHKPCNNNQIHSEFPDNRIMDHFGINNVTYDTKSKMFYAVGIDWSIWMVNLSICPAKQTILTPTNWRDTMVKNPSSAICSFRSFICKPYLFLDQNDAYILTIDGSMQRYKFNVEDYTIQGFVLLSTYRKLLMKNCSII